MEARALLGSGPRAARHLRVSVATPLGRVGFRSEPW